MFFTKRLQIYNEGILSELNTFQHYLFEKILNGSVVNRASHLKKDMFYFRKVTELTTVHLRVSNEGITKKK